MTRIYHLASTPAIERTESDWRLSRIYNNWLDRDETNTITVRVGRGTAADAPGAWWPQDRVIELDGTWARSAADTAEADTETVSLESVEDLARIAVLHGLFIHENSHARHTTLHTISDGAPAQVWAIATMLEEARIEKAAVTENPDNAMWLKAAVNALISREHLTDITSALLLISAREHAGVLSTADTAQLNSAIVATIGPGVYDSLAVIWQQAQDVPDDNPHELLTFAGAWLDILNEQQITPPTGGADGNDDSPGESGRSIAALADAAAKSAQSDAATEVADAASIEASISQLAETRRATQERKLRDNADEHADAVEAKQHARVVFGETVGHGRSDTGHRASITSWRAPTAHERASAARLSRQLQQMLWTPPARTTTPTRQPGGKLNYRGAIALEAQKHLGLALTAKDWNSTRIDTQPPLKLAVGVALDRSGSMRQLVAPASQAAWIIAAASRRIGAKFAAVTFGERTEAMCAPGTWPAGVAQLRADAGHESIGSATSALTGILPFNDPTYIRLLFIFSDGVWVHRDENERGRANIAKLTRNGCHVILANSGKTAAIPHTTPLAVDPTAVCETLSAAITTAVRQAQNLTRH